jgi:gamma-glutamyl hercynylcysteine S-oxide synthase
VVQYAQGSARGSHASSARIAWPLYRNFFTPKRNDVIAGFRNCAL